MIYILVQDAEGFDDCDRPVFASSDQALVERIHDQIKKRNQSFQTIAKRFASDMEQINKLMPPPKEPKLTGLPKRPLIWRVGGWKNAYIEEYEVELRKHNEAIDAERNRLKREYAEYYTVSLEDMDSIWGYQYDRRYSIDEVEDDPNVDIKRL